MQETPVRRLRILVATAFPSRVPTLVDTRVACEPPPFLVPLAAISGVPQCSPDDVAYVSVVPLPS